MFCFETCLDDGKEKGISKGASVGMRGKLPQDDGALYPEGVDHDVVTLSEYIFLYPLSPERI